MKPTVLALAALLAGTVSSNAQVVAGPITNSANGHHYYLLVRTNWAAAQAHAVSLGGHLAIRNADENAWVLSTFRPYFGAADLFVGLTDRSREGAFAWVSGETNAFRHWASGEPNNASGNEDRVEIRTEMEGGTMCPGQAMATMASRKSCVARPTESRP